MSSRNLIIGIGIALTLLSCGSEYENKMSASHSAPAEIEESEKSEYFPSAITKISKLDSTRKFVRTAELKFKVKNVEETTYKLERMVTSFEGFVIHSQLSANSSYDDYKRFSEDSVIKKTYYVMENDVTFRVPTIYLDTVLFLISKQIDFLEYRTLKAEDVSFQALRNKLGEKRFKDHEKKINKANQKNRAKDQIDTENNLFYQQDVAEDNAVNALELKDRIAFSTIRLIIYQNQKHKEEKEFSPKERETYKTPFAKQFTDSIKFGWELIEFLVLLLIKLWPIIIIGLLLFYGIRRLVRKPKT